MFQFQHYWWHPHNTGGWDVFFATFGLFQQQNPPQTPCFSLQRKVCHSTDSGQYILGSWSQSWQKWFRLSKKKAFWPDIVEALPCSMYLHRNLNSNIPSKQKVLPLWMTQLEKGSGLQWQFYTAWWIWVWGHMYDHHGIIIWCHHGKNWLHFQDYHDQIQRVSTSSRDSSLQSTKNKQKQVPQKKQSTVDPSSSTCTVIENLKKELRNTKDPREIRIPGPTRQPPPTPKSTSFMERRVFLKQTAHDSTQLTNKQGCSIGFAASISP